MDKKAILAFILCAVITIYMVKFMQPPPPPPTTEEEGIEKSVYEKAVVKEKEAPGKVEKAEEQKKKITIVQEEIDLQDNILIQNDVIMAVLTNEGAAIKSVVLTKFVDPGKTQILQLLKPNREDR